MTPRKFIDMLVAWWTPTDTLVEYLQVIDAVVARTSDYTSITKIISELDLPQFDQLVSLVEIIHQCDMLHSGSITSLIRECRNSSTEQIVHTADPDLVQLDGDANYVKTTTIGLDVRQGQRIYKRSLDTDVSKLLG